MGRPETKCRLFNALIMWKLPLRKDSELISIENVSIQRWEATKTLGIYSSYSSSTAKHDQHAMCFICFITIHPIFPARTRPPDTMGKLGGEQGTLLVAYISNQLLKQGQQHSSWVRFFAGIIEKMAKNGYLSCTEILQPTLWENPH